MLVAFADGLHVRLLETVMFQLVPGPEPSGTEALLSILSRATGWLVGIVATIATLYLTVGGVRYLLAGGDPQQIDGAKRSVRSALIGYAIAGLAPLLVRIAKSILGI
ncbi:pilin [Hamadaea sp. NPDC051192]|uniref:pilin n=1 Tax=Hamadaea sp. NPDC051192 TaxID=3154940 RepID=UPI00341AAE3C